ncbi:MAG TPA: NADH-quinone oxidoreductase subunit NuoN [Alphaproteobacteria bacterium]
MTAFTWSSLAPLWPQIFLALSGMTFLLAGAWRGDGGTLALCRASMAAFLLTAVFLMGVDWAAGPALNGMFAMDQFSGFASLLVLTGLIAAMALTTEYLFQENMARFEYPVLVMFAGLGMLLMVSAHNLLAAYVGLELQSLALYVLAAFRRDHPQSSEAGLKYFVLGALASGILLFGMSLVYGYTGTLDFTQINMKLDSMGHPGTGLVVGMVFLLIGVAFKISAVPFHMWTPDVYEGAPTSVTALFAIVPKMAAMALLMRLLFEPFQAALPEWQQIIWFLSLASMATGAFAGLVQRNIKRLMAYSSIGNMGYALVGVAAGTPEGAGAVLVYMAIYMATTAGVFGIILAMRIRGRAATEIEDLAGLSRTSPLLAYSMAFLMFSMSGIPPLAGFFGKLFVFQAAVQAELYVLAVLGVLSSVVAAYYYLRVIKVMFFDEPADSLDTDISFSTRAIIFLSIAFTLFFILSPSVLVETSRAAALALFGG